MRSASFKLLLCLSVLCCFSTKHGHAQSAGPPAFDLTGPNIDVKVSRAGKTLPISEVPNLAVGDRLWVHPDLPDTQSVHYLLVVAFLRGSTNPPPFTWFTKFETWKPTADEGIHVVVPAGAQQALLFLAPETGGDFKTLRNAVRGRPGAFVRASQDLNQASLDRGRLDTYLAAIKDANAGDPKDLQERSTLLARSLNIRLDQQCFDKPTEQQAPCLVKNPSELVLDDGHSQSVVASLTSGSSADLLAQVSYAGAAGGGIYSAYVGAVIDMARIFDSFLTAEYQYIPALGVAKKGALELKLNTPPSFHKPMSVLVVGLPAIEKSQPPPLRPVDEKQEYCLLKDSVVLPAAGGPLAFSTEYAHNVSFRLQGGAGKTVEVQARADAARGGYVLDAGGIEAGALDAGKFGPDVVGRLHGEWGFEPFEGPEFKVQIAQGAKWALSVPDQHSIIVGRVETLHFQSPAASCVVDVTATLRDGKGGDGKGGDGKSGDGKGGDAQATNGRKLDAAWRATAPDEITVDLPLTNAKAGDLTLKFKEAGNAKPEEVSFKTYAEPGRLEGFTIYAGDKQGMLRGTGLDEVAGLEVHGIHFAPPADPDARANGPLPMTATDAKATASLHPYDKFTAKVTLNDGRTLDLPASVEPGRPRVSLLNKTVQPGDAASRIKLTSADELPVDAQLTFALKAESPGAFKRNEKVEVASQDDSFRVLLSVADNTLVLQDARTALLTLDPAKAFGGSAFGPLQFRPIDGNGIAGDWQPLVTLVRVPQLTDIKCPPSSQDQPCILDGSNLFLLDSVATDAGFTHSVTVPEGFATSSLGVPRPSGPELYVKLRDDPTVISTASVPVQRR